MHLVTAYIQVGTSLLVGYRYRHLTLTYLLTYLAYSMGRVILEKLTCS
jgi:hypothetical protein